MNEIGSIFQQAYQYALSHAAELAGALSQHVQLSGAALAISLALGLPLGIWAARRGGPGAALLNLAGGLRVVPSLAVLFLLVPYLGLSSLSAGAALTLLALPPVLINTHAAFRGLDPAVQEAARGMGMRPRQVLWRVELPLALPLILTGVRTAAVEVISSATLAAFVGSGGLGIYITRGFALYDYAILLVGAVPVALLTLLAEMLLGALQRRARLPS